MNGNRKLLKSKSNQEGNISFGHLNIRSLHSKIDQVSHIVKQYNYDVFAVCETWLDDTIADSEIAIDGYDIYRRDRSNDTRGGGVCLYVKQMLDFTVRNDLQDINIESLWGEVKCRKSSFPPKYEMHCCKSFINHKLKLCWKCVTVIM